MEVFFIDFGFYETVSIKDIYPLKTKFCQYPSQRLQLTLAGIKINKIAFFKEYLDYASLKSDYFYAIVKKTLGENYLEVMLFGNFEDKTFCINKEAIELEFGFADHGTIMSNKNNN